MRGRVTLVRFPDPPGPVGEPDKTNTYTFNVYIHTYTLYIHPTIFFILLPTQALPKPFASATESATLKTFSFFILF